VEREIARRLGGRRIPITGRQRGDVPDVEHDWLAVEIKHRKALPDYWHDAYAQAQAANDGSRLSVVIWHEKGRPHRDDYIMMRLGDFEKYFGDDSD